MSVPEPLSVLEQLRGQLIVSCQAPPGSPFRETAIICAFARAATANGAAGLRVESLADVQAVRRQETVPLIGLIKRAGREVFITPELEDVWQLTAAGAFAVVVGSAITRSDEVTRWFAQEIRHARQGS